MQRILIPFFATLLFAVTGLRAQVPLEISISGELQPAQVSSRAMMCNNAGTVNVGPLIGQSNDATPDTIYLCSGDSLRIDHNGDFDLSGDPSPVTPPGVGYAFYRNPPTVMGDNIAAILADPNIFPGSVNGIYITAGTANGDAVFLNDESLQNSLSDNIGLPPGAPLLVWFAPITIDALPNLYENGGPCVNVNTDEAFAVVYLNNITNSPPVDEGNCLMRFTLRGGLPEFNTNEVYTVSITRQGNPSVKGIIYTAASQLKHLSVVYFSVPEPGLYDVVVEDGKSCGHTFQVNVPNCDPTASIQISMPELIAPQGTQICVPVTVGNFNNMSGLNFSLEWNEAILSYQNVSGVNPIFDGFGPGNLNTGQVTSGQLGILLRNENDPTVALNLADGDTLFSVCFTAIGPWESCSGITVTNNPTQINAADTLGMQDLAIFVDTGQVCIDTLPLQVMVDVLPTCSSVNAPIMVTAIGGSPSYDVYIRNTNGTGGVTFFVLANDGDSAIRNLGSGTYTVCVVDENGTNFPDSVCTTVTINIQTLGASLDLTQTPSCFGFSDGAVTANVLVGSSIISNPDPLDYSFSWSVGSPPTPLPGNFPVQTGLLAGGPYSVTITDLVSGCTAVASGTLGQPTPVVEDDRTVTPASCTGICDGQILFDARGGTPFPGGEYNYNWEYSPTATGTPTPYFNLVDSVSNPGPLCSGFYYVTVTDARQCTFVLSTEIEVPDLRSLQLDLLSIQQPECAGTATGELCVELTASPAFGPGSTYSFFWAGCNGLPLTQTDSANTSCVTNLPACTISLIAVETGTGCLSMDTFTIMDPAPLILDTISIQNPTCTGLTDGAITVLASGGTGPLTYAYLWGCDTTLTGPAIAGLPEGNYCVTVSDANGCEDSLSFDIMLPPPPAINGFIPTPVRCGSDGGLEVNAPTGVLFEWRNVANDSVLQSGPTNPITGLPGGTYAVIVVDQLGCSNVDTATLAPVMPLTIDTSATVFTEPSCFAATDGSIGISVSGGTAPYNYNWSNNNGGPVNGPIGGGTYTVTVTDAQTCTAVETFTLTQPPAIGAQQNNITPVSCFGTCDGAIEIVAFFNTIPPTPGTFSFTWPDGPAPGVRNDLCAGTYAVTITDDVSGCSRVETVIIGGPQAVTANITTVPATCFDTADGRATATGSGGNGGPFTFLWSSGATTGTANSLEGGETYFVTITDNSGCTGVETVTIGRPDSIVITASATDVNCFGADDGTLSASATGGNAGNYTFTWGNANNIPVGTGSMIDGLTAGNYFVTVTDSQGCTNSFGPVSIIEPPAIQGLIEPIAPLDCNGDVTTLSIDTIFGGWGGPYRYSVDGGQPTAIDFDFFPLTGGEHVVAYFDVQGCSVLDTILVFEPPALTVTFDPTEILVNLGDSTQLMPILSNGQISFGSLDTFIWSPLDRLRPDFNNTVTDPFFEPFVYTFESEFFTLTVIDTNGCTGSGSVYVRIDANRNVYIPNVFKPGADINRNDRFLPLLGQGVRKVNFFRVFDRWGSLVYENDNFPVIPDEFVDGWDGRINGKFVDPAVFVYAIEVEFLDGRVILYRGDVTVVR